MITFNCLKTIKYEKPPIIETKTDNGYTFEYSDYCFVKNKHGYTIARYCKCKEQNSEYWDDSPSIHPLNENDEWHLLSDRPIFSFHTKLCNPFEDIKPSYIDENGFIIDSDEFFIQIAQNAGSSSKIILKTFEETGLMGVYNLGIEHALNYTTKKEE